MIASRRRRYAARTIFFAATSVHCMLQTIIVSRELIAGRKAREAIEASGGRKVTVIDKRVVTANGETLEPGILTTHIADLVAKAEQLARDAAAEHGLGCAIDYHEIFVASLNAPEAVAHLRRALDDERIVHDEAGLPMRASEDFGTFGHRARSAMFFLGAGETHPALHNPDYDFPDDLITIGARIFIRTMRNILG